MQRRSSNSANAARAVLAAAVLIVSDATPILAAPITINYDFGVIDLACTSEGAACPQDILPGTSSAVGNVYTNIFNGGYRAGGRVDWDFTFDTSPFASISAITMQIDVVGLWGAYPGNIGPGGQLGNFFAIDGVPLVPFLLNTDGRDSHLFAIPSLSAGAHVFTVQVYDPAFSPGPFFEGWGGVDFARLSVTGETAAAVPEPASLLLVASALAGLCGTRFRRKSV